MLRETKPDLIYHLGEPSELSSAQVVQTARRVCPQARIVLFSFENVDRQWRGFPQLLRGAAERFVLPRVDMFAACTHTAAAALQRAGVDPSRIRVVYLGSDPERFQPREATELRTRLCPDDGFLVGYVGRLVPEKGVDVLLHALAALPEECVLCVIGAGACGPELAELAADLGVRNRLQWLGRVDHGAMPEHLSAFDALVLPSRSIPTWQEQYGAVLVEAMLCGTAVVGSSSGAIPEVIGEAGLTFPENDAAALAEVLARLRDDRVLREELGRKGLARARAEFTVAAHVQRLRELFAESCG
jgi:glycosyltransferase involved in cell wall biosynthesis